MKRTKPLEIFSGRRERDIPADELHDVELAFDEFGGRRPWICLYLTLRYATLAIIKLSFPAIYPELVEWTTGNPGEKIFLSGSSGQARG